MRKRNYYRYCDDSVTYYDKTTTVEGTLSLDFFEHAKLIELHKESNKCHCGFKGIIRKAGVAKCLDEDTFDKKKGLIVASRKAELKTMKTALSDFTKYRRALEKELELVKDIEDKLDLKTLKLSLELVKISRE